MIDTSPAIINARWPSPGRSLQVLHGVEVRGVVDVQVAEAEEPHDRWTALARRGALAVAQPAALDDASSSTARLQGTAHLQSLRCTSSCARLQISKQGARWRAAAAMRDARRLLGLSAQMPAKAHNLNLCRPARFGLGQPARQGAVKGRTTRLSLLVTFIAHVLNRFPTVKPESPLPNGRACRSQPPTSDAAECGRARDHTIDELCEEWATATLMPTRPENSRTSWRNGRWMCAIPKTSLGYARQSSRG